MGLTTSPAGGTPSRFEGFDTTVTAGGTTTLTAASKWEQFATGSSAQDFVLPVVSTLYLGFAFRFTNLSSGTIQVFASGGGILFQLLPGEVQEIFCILVTGTDYLSWNYNNVDSRTLLIAKGYIDDQILLSPKLPHVIYDRITSIGNVSTDGTEDLLEEIIIPAFTMSNNGQKISWSTSMVTIANATATKRIKFYFRGSGSDEVIWDSGNLTLSLDTNFFFTIHIYRFDQSTAIVTVSVATTSASTVPYVSFHSTLYDNIPTSVNWDGDTILRIKGIAAGIGAQQSDIMLESGTLTILPAGTTVV